MHSITVTWYSPIDNRVYKLPDDTPLFRVQRMCEEYFTREYPLDVSIRAFKWEDAMISRFILC